MATRTKSSGRNKGRLVETLREIRNSSTNDNVARDRATLALLRFIDDPEVTGMFERCCSPATYEYRDVCCICRTRTPDPASSDGTCLPCILSGQQVEARRDSLHPEGI